jgi:hypothetical protein
MEEHARNVARTAWAAAGGKVLSEPEHIAPDCLRRTYSAYVLRLNPVQDMPVHLAMSDRASVAQLVGGELGRRFPGLESELTYEKLPLLDRVFLRESTRGDDLVREEIERHLSKVMGVLFKGASPATAAGLAAGFVATPSPYAGYGRDGVFSGPATVDEVLAAERSLRPIELQEWADALASGRDAYLVRVNRHVCDEEGWQPGWRIISAVQTSDDDFALRLADATEILAMVHRDEPGAKEESVARVLAETLWATDDEETQAKAFGAMRIIELPPRAECLAAVVERLRAAEAAAPQALPDANAGMGRNLRSIV